MHNPERLDPLDPSFRPETKRHHEERYRFASLFSGQSWLDLCCGYGYGTQLIKESHPKCHVVGVDSDATSILEARQRYSDVHFVIADAKNFTHEAPFDIVIMFEAIEHLTYKEGLATLKHIRTNLLAEGGWLLLSTPRDIQHEKNHFHKSMWTFPMLKNILGSSFAKVNIYGQDWQTGTISSVDVIDSAFYLCVCQK